MESLRIASALTDKLPGITEAFKADTFKEKINLGMPRSLRPQLDISDLPFQESAHTVMTTDNLTFFPPSELQRTRLSMHTLTKSTLA